MPSTGRFYLHGPDISLIEATIDKFGPGGIPLPLTKELSLNSPDLIEVDQVALFLWALFVGQ